MINTTFSNVQYNNSHKSSIKAVVDGMELHIPTDPANRHYAEILKQVEAGELTIQEADE